MKKSEQKAVEKIQQHQLGVQLFRYSRQKSLVRGPHEHGAVVW